MHIPNGFLDGKTIVSTTAVSAGFLTYAVRRSKEALRDKYIPLIGVTAAFIFAAQMLNFPIAGGTSGHFMGAAFAVIVAGPYAGALILALVIALQCLIFQDGGLTALGANILNMAIIAPLFAYAVFKGVNKLGNNNIIKNTSIFLSGMIAVVAASAFASIELAASGRIAFNIVFPAMTGVHILIGITEGLLTVGAIAMITRLKPDILNASREKLRPVAVSLLGISAIILLITPFASSSPDGMEKVAIVKGFFSKSLPPSYATFFSDYKIPALSGSASTILAGLAGAVAVVLLTYGALLLIKGANADGP